MNSIEVGTNTAAKVFFSTREKRWGNQEWVIQRHWQHWVHGAKTRRKAMGQSRMGNPETLATLGTRGEDEDKSDGAIKNG